MQTAAAVRAASARSRCRARTFTLLLPKETSPDACATVLGTNLDAVVDHLPDGLPVGCEDGLAGVAVVVSLFIHPGGCRPPRIGWRQRGGCGRPDELPASAARTAAQRAARRWSRRGRPNGADGDQDQRGAASHALHGPSSRCAGLCTEAKRPAIGQMTDAGSLRCDESGAYRGRARADAELLEDVLHVRPHGRRRDEEPRRDLAVGEALRYQLEDLELSRRQAVDPRPPFPACAQLCQVRPKQREQCPIPLGEVRPPTSCKLEEASMTGGRG